MKKTNMPNISTISCISSHAQACELMYEKNVTHFVQKRLTHVEKRLTNLKLIKALSQNKEEQIVVTREKSQWIVVQGLLSHLQYPDSTKSSAKDLSEQHRNL